MCVLVHAYLNELGGVWLGHSDGEVAGALVCVAYCSYFHALRLNTFFIHILHPRTCVLVSACTFIVQMNERVAGKYYSRSKQMY